MPFSRVDNLSVRFCTKQLYRARGPSSLRGISPKAPCPHSRGCIGIIYLCKFFRPTAPHSRGCIDQEMPRKASEIPDHIVLLFCRLPAKHPPRGRGKKRRWRPTEPSEKFPEGSLPPLAWVYPVLKILQNGRRRYPAPSIVVKCCSSADHRPPWDTS